MRLNLAFIAFAQAALLLIPQAACLAGTINYTPDLSGGGGEVVGKIQLDRLGAVEVPRGRVAFKNNRIEVTTIPEWQFDRLVVLSGPVLRADASVSGGVAQIKGLAYFNEGDWLHYLSPDQIKESIVTDAGELVGHIQTITGGGIDFVQDADGSHRLVQAKDVKQIYSSRAYNFSIVATTPGATSGQAFQTEAYNIALKPANYRPFHLAALKTDLRRESDGDLTDRQLVVIGATINAIQVAQMLPCLIYPLTSAHDWRVAKNKLFQINAPAISPAANFTIPSSVIPPPAGF